MTQLWRMQCLTAVGDVTDFCVACPHTGGDDPHTPNYYRLSDRAPWEGRGIVAIGWGVDVRPATKDDYRRLAWRKYGPARGFSAAVNAFLDYMSIGDLIWIRNQRSEYYIGKITGDWQYADADCFKRRDIAHVRTCDWLRVGRMDEVPSCVRNAFDCGEMIERVDEPSIVEYSRLLFAERRPNGEPLPAETSLRGADVLTLISAADLKDVVALYLQVVERCALLPSTCKNAAPAIDCAFTKLDGSGRIAMQVQSGSEAIDQSRFAGFDGTAYVFSTTGNYKGSPSGTYRLIKRSDLLDFIFQHTNLLPGTVAWWAERINRANGRREGELPS